MIAILSISFVVLALYATNTPTASTDDGGTTTVDLDDNQPDPVYEDFEGPVKKVTVLLIIKQISDDIHDLFAKKTEFDSIEKELLNHETKVDYIFPDEAVIIKGIGKVLQISLIIVYVIVCFSVTI